MTLLHQPEETGETPDTWAKWREKALAFSRPDPDIIARIRAAERIIALELAYRDAEARGEDPATDSGLRHRLRAEVDARYPRLSLA